MADEKKLKKSGIHWQDRSDDVVFHVGSKGKVQTWPKNKFYSCFPREPKHGINDSKWMDYLAKNDKAGKEFREKYA